MNGEFVWIAYGALILLLGGYGVYLYSLGKRLREDE